VLQVIVPDRHGVPGDVVLGYDDLAAVQAGSPSMGAFIGRMAGRIGQARFTLDGHTHRLAANAGAHCLHGGPRGSRHRVFQAQQPDARTLVLHHRFDPADDGFPGTLALRLTYRLGEDHELLVEHEACALDGRGPASFASHAFFSLDGAGQGSIDDQQLMVTAGQLLATDADNVATGAFVPLDGHTLDLRTPQPLGGTPDRPPLVLDHAYVVAPASDAQERLCARLLAPRSGRTLEVWSTEPVLQVYTADPLGRSSLPDIGKQGLRHHPRAGLCLEPQQFPNAPNCPAFPPSLVEPGRPYRARTRYRFGVTD
jgi:aldose 1-epimerase